MNHLVTLANASKTLSPAQKTFQRLTQQISNLKRAIEERRAELEAGVDFHWKKIIPSEKARSEALVGLVKAKYAVYKNKKGFRSSERKNIVKILQTEITEIFNPIAPIEIDSELDNIFKDLNGRTYSEWISEETNGQKEELEELFKSEGIDIDLSSINPMDSQEEIMRKIAEEVLKKRLLDEPNPEPTPKSKKQTEKQKKIEALKEAQSKGISILYKQLARVIHPDLEQDPVEHAKKVELMKELTVAYENNDLLTLLDLEMKWLNDGSGTQANHRNQEQLKLYNQVLKEQVEILKISMDGLAMHPRFHYAHKYNSVLSLALCQKKHHNELKKDVTEMNRRAQVWSSPVTTLSQLRSEITLIMDEHMFDDLLSDLF